jgi:hypothetical protein
VETIFSLILKPIKSSTRFGMRLLVFELGDSSDYHSLAEWLESTQPVTQTPGNYQEWAERWVIDSVTQAEKAYCNIEFNSATIAGRWLQIAIQLPSSVIIVPNLRETSIIDIPTGISTWKMVVAIIQSFRLLRSSHDHKTARYLSASRGTLSSSCKTNAGAAQRNPLAR